MSALFELRAFAKIAKNRRPAAGLLLAEVHHQAEAAFARAAFADILDLAEEILLLGPDAASEEEQAFRGFAVTAGAADLLVVALH